MARQSGASFMNCGRAPTTLTQRGMADGFLGLMSWESKPSWENSVGSIGASSGPGIADHFVNSGVSLRVKGEIAAVGRTIDPVVAIRAHHQFKIRLEIFDG